MKTLWAVTRLIGLVIWLLLWVLALPFIIAIWAIRLAIARAKFKSQLLISGVPHEWAKRMAKRYTISIRDCIRFTRFRKSGSA